LQDVPQLDAKRVNAPTLLTVAGNLRAILFIPAPRASMSAPLNAAAQRPDAAQIQTGVAMSTSSKAPIDKHIYSLIDATADSTRAPQVRLKTRNAVRRAIESDAAKRRAIPLSLKKAATKKPMVAAKGDDDLMSQPQQP
jgi:hypothetical protein